jgi:TonB family protein
MKTFSRLFSLLFIFLTFTNIEAQTKKAVETVSVGIVNGKAVLLPKPEYPMDARQSNLTGTVKIQVVIDERGKVMSAKTVSGIENQEIRKLCETAAMKAEFSPTILSGKPVKVSGVIVYNFIDDRTNELKLKTLKISTFLYTIRSQP